MSPHSVYPNDCEAKKALQKLCNERLLPFPLALNYVSFHFNEDLYLPSDKTIEMIELEIKREKSVLADIEKMLYIFEEIILPSRKIVLPYSGQTLWECSFLTLDFLCSVLHRYTISMDHSIRFLQDDLHSKHEQTRKKREKRRRYKTNKNARNSFCGTLS